MPQPTLIISVKYIFVICYATININYYLSFGFLIVGRPSPLEVGFPGLVGQVVPDAVVVTRVSRC